MKKIFTYLFLLISLCFFQSCVDKIVVADVGPPQGKIILESEPPGAQIFLLGTNTNKVTPDSLMLLKSGDYEVTLKKQNYRDTTIILTVYDSLTTSQIIILKSIFSTGNILIESQPAGAEIFLDSVNINKITPDTIKNLIVGDHQLILKKPGYVDTSFVIAVQKDMTISKSIILQKVVTRGNIYISSNPAGADIFLDSINTGSITPDTLKNIPTGDHRITLKKYNYVDTSLNIAVQENKTTSKTVTLNQIIIRGNVFLQTEPNGAQIFLDNINTNKITPDTIANLPIGNHTFTLKKNNYRDTTFQINVIAYLTISKNVVLTDIRGSIFIQSVPSGAEIYVGDKFTNKYTPDTVKSLISGTYKVTLKYTGYNDTTFYVDVSQNTMSIKNITMVKSIEYGDLYIQSSPSGAGIYLNNNNTSKATPDSIKHLEVGNYNITLKLPDYADTTFSVSIQKDLVTTEYINLREKLPVQLDTLYYELSQLGYTSFKFSFNQDITLDKVEVIEPGSTDRNSIPFNGDVIPKGTTKIIYYPNYKIGVWQLIFYGNKASASKAAFILQKNLSIP